jgi:hypothetical protein
MLTLITYLLGLGVMAAMSMCQIRLARRDGVRSGFELGVLAAYTIQRTGKWRLDQHTLAAQQIIDGFEADLAWRAALQDTRDHESSDHETN